jgi:Uma2 family endonuclease
MSTVAKKMTVDDLRHHSGKAELIGGRIVELMPTGIRPNEVAGNIYVSLRAYAKRVGPGRAFTDNLGYTVPQLPSGRESFSPDASYYLGPLPTDTMGFVEGPPTFAVEVRSEGDYGDAAEAEQTAKRADYFAAGTLVVWDVDPVAELIYRYRAAAPSQAVVFRRGQVADAEPAVPGWRITVKKVFA